MARGSTASERITWEDCPSCRGQAAVGWRHAVIVEFDCPNGCWPTLQQAHALATRLGAGSELDPASARPDRS